MKSAAEQSISFSPGYLAFRHFLTERMAVISVCFVGFLFLLALLAPFIANALPLFVWDGQSCFSPALRDFFAPDVQEVFVEKVFNYLLLAVLPVWFLRKHWKILIAVLLLLAVPFFTVSRVNDRTDYRGMKDAVVVFAPVSCGPFATSPQTYEKPSLQHWMGTDQSGRDVFARMLYGSRVSLAVGVMASGISLLLGVSVGLFSGYLGGRVDLWIQRIVETVICFPTFLLLLILMALMLDHGSRQSVLLVILVLGCTGWPGLARLVRGEVLKQRQMQYIQACETSGVPFRRILFRHLLPNVAGPVFVCFAFDIAGAILAENSLSFLGFGVQIPTASWGELLRQALDDPLTYWNLMLWPGLAIFLCVCSFNFIADGLRNSLDRKS